MDEDTVQRLANEYRSRSTEELLGLYQRVGNSDIGTEAFARLLKDRNVPLPPLPRKETFREKGIRGTSKSNYMNKHKIALWVTWVGIIVTWATLITSKINLLGSIGVVIHKLLIIMYDAPPGMYFTEVIYVTVLLITEFFTLYLLIRLILALFPPYIWKRQNKVNSPKRTINLASLVLLLFGIVSIISNFYVRQDMRYGEISFQTALRMEKYGIGYQEAFQREFFSNNTLFYVGLLLLVLSLIIFHKRAKHHDI